MKRLLPVNAAMKPAWSSRSRMARAASCKPAIQPSVRASSAAASAAVSGNPITLGQKGCGLVGGEAQLLGAQLGDLPARAQPCERQRRILARGDNQVQRGRQMVEQEAHRLVDRRRLQYMVVVQHQDALVRHCGQVVDQDRQQGFQWRRRRLQPRQHRRAHLGRQRLQRRHQVAQKHRRVAISRI